MATTIAVKRNDLAPSVVGTLTNADGTVVNLTGSTVRFKMRDNRGQLKVNALATVTSPAAGAVSYDWVLGDTDTAGPFQAELEVTLPSGKVETFPNRGFIPVLIDEDVDVLAIPAPTLPTVPQAILTALLTVDGAGSGLDADLLDGMDTPALAASTAFTSRYARKVHIDIRDFGATEGADNTVAIQAALTAVPTAGGVVDCSGIHVSLISATLVPKSNTEIRGIYGGQVDYAGVQDNGTCFQAASTAFTGPMINCTGVEFVTIDGINFYGSGTGAGFAPYTTTGIRYDSTAVAIPGTPAGHHFWCSRCSFNFLAEAIHIGTSIASDNQCDLGIIEKFHIINCNYGIVIESANGFSTSRIANGVMTGVNKGLWIKNAGFLVFESVAFGNPVGTLPAFIEIDGSGHNVIDFRNIQAETAVGGALFIRVNTTGGADTTHTLLFQSCTFNVPSDIQIQHRIIGIGNYHTAEFLLSGAGVTYTSIGDTFSGAGNINATGAGSQVVSFTPTASVAPALNFSSLIDGEVVRLTSALLNPSLGISNTGAGGTKWLFISARTGGLLAGGMVLRNETNGLNPFQVEPDAATDVLHLKAQGVYVSRLLAKTGSPPTVAMLAGAGTSPPAAVVAGNANVRGSVTFGSGTATGTGAILRVSHAAAFLSAAYPVITPTTAATTGLGLFIGAVTGNYFEVWATVAPTVSQANTVYGFYYQVIG
jgi:hypothetical protein